MDVDLDRAKRLQAGHGDWVPGMERVSRAVFNILSQLD